MQSTSNSVREHATAVAIPPAPVPPVQPDINDCCRSGCTPCVFDLYEEAMERYRAELAAYRARYPAA